MLATLVEPSLITNVTILHNVNVIKAVVALDPDNNLTVIMPFKLTMLKLKMKTQISSTPSLRFMIQLA